MCAHPHIWLGHEHGSKNTVHTSPQNVIPQKNDVQYQNSCIQVTLTFDIGVVCLIRKKHSIYYVKLQLHQMISQTVMSVLSFYFVQVY